MDLQTVYDEDYFERGIVKGISGYYNYSWLPELTIRMAHYLITQLPITPNQRVLDFGCAKGFMVKALRILDIDAYGVDISEYAISQVPPDVRNHCVNIKNSAFDLGLEFGWVIAKDVMEHLPETEIGTLLVHLSGFAKRMFAAIPLGEDNFSNKFIVPEYNKDITHITARTQEWWRSIFSANGWSIKEFSYDYRGVKENWTKAWPKGNGFFICESTRLRP